MIIQQIETYEIIILSIMLVSSFIPLYKYLSYKKNSIGKKITAFKYAAIRGPIFFLITIPLYLAEINIFIVAAIYLLFSLYNVSLTRKSLSSHRYYQKNNQDTIYVFNGDYTYLHFKDYFIGKRTIVFNEALVLGDISGQFLGKDFIDRRIAFLSDINHDEDVHLKYDNFVQSMHELTVVGSYKNVELYFDKDMFCQINILALLHYLHINNYKGKAILNYLPYDFKEGTIDDYITNSIRITESELAFLSGLYIIASNNNLKVISNNRYKEKYSVIINGLNLYLDLVNHPENMKKIISETYTRCDNNKKKTIISLLNELEEYGLPDIYYKHILNEIE